MTSDPAEKTSTAVAVEEIADFNRAFAAWAENFRRSEQDLELDEVMAVVAPWIEELRTIIGRVGLARIGCRGECLRRTLNQVLDGCELHCQRHGVRIAEVLIRFEGVEDILVGLALLADGYIPMASVEKAL